MVVLLVGLDVVVVEEAHARVRQGHAWHLTLMTHPDPTTAAQVGGGLLTRRLPLYPLLVQVNVKLSLIL